MVSIWCITLLTVERLWVIYWASRVRMVKVVSYSPPTSLLFLITSDKNVCHQVDHWDVLGSVYRAGHAPAARIQQIRV